jgi:predicted phage terminase large subunit-like protein
MIKVSRDDFIRIVIGVDPAVTSGDDADETGIVVVALGPHQPDTCRIIGCGGHAYVVADETIPREQRPSVDQWAQQVVDAFDHWQADRVVAEGNQGGELVEQILRTHRPGLPVKRVHARVGKRTRAEPIAALYEQGRVHHVGSAPQFAALEDQLTTWTQSSNESPDRMDALVWAISALGISGGSGILPDFAPIGMGKRNDFDLGGMSIR